MRLLTEIHRAGGINIHGKAIERTAVRAVVLCDGKLLMVYFATVGDYKFPGGGVDDGKTHVQALGREVREECGASLLRVDGELGAVVEYNFPIEKKFDVFKMTSHYYFCTLANEPFGKQKLDGYESDLGFEPIWIGIENAIRINKSLLDSSHPPEWLRREIFVLEYINQIL